MSPRVGCRRSCTGVTDLGDLAAEDAAALVASSIRPLAGNVVDRPVRVAVLPEHRTGWLGRPGLSGSRTGRDWSPEFIVTRVELDGRVIEPTVEVTLVSSDAGMLTVEAADEAAPLRLILTLELSLTGLLRTRATVTKTGRRDVHARRLVLSFPVPPRRPNLDFAGPGATERVPQRRRSRPAPTCGRDRKGRTGAGRGYVLHAGTPDSASRRRVWAVHTAGAATTRTTPSGSSPASR